MFSFVLVLIYGQLKSSAIQAALMVDLQLLVIGACMTLKLM
jgi:hypothetical protein